MRPILDIIVVSFNNYQLLHECLSSIVCSLDQVTKHMVRIIVVNNGQPGMRDAFGVMPGIEIYDAGKNLGWEAGLKFGLTKSDAPFVAFSNDDIRFVSGDKSWVNKMLSLFNDPNVGAVGPSSNYVMGQQSIFADSNKTLLSVKYLIGFFLLLRREALERAGGVDDTLPGGDDIDLSIRLRDNGYSLICRRDVFVYHHGSVTGNAVQSGYWNSPQMQEKTNLALIRKHGMLKFWETMVIGWQNVQEYRTDFPTSDIEGSLCKEHILGEKILEVGCGAVKTDPRSVAVDQHAKGEFVPFVTETNSICKSDIVADVSQPLPVEPCSFDTVIARHILEHCQDTLSTLSNWNRALRNNGRLIIAVPNNSLGNTIIGNPEHVVTFVPSSLINSAKVCGFKHLQSYENINGQNMLCVFEKVSSPVMALENTKTVHSLAAQYANA